MSQNITISVVTTTVVAEIANSTLVPPFDTTVGNTTTTIVYSNITEQPYNDYGGVPMLPPPANTNYTVYVPTTLDPNYYPYSIYAYLVLVALLLMVILFTKLALKRRQELARAAAQRARVTFPFGMDPRDSKSDFRYGGLQNKARQQCPITTISSGQVNSNSAVGTDSPPKDIDLPPGYDEVMQTYINAKLQLQTDEEGAVGGMASAVSSVTIETEVGASTTELATMTTTTTTTNNDTTTVATCQQPPSYESTFGDNSNGSHNNDSIV